MTLGSKQKKSQGGERASIGNYEKHPKNWLMETNQNQKERELGGL